jgi:hypothetical protein
VEELTELSLIIRGGDSSSADDSSVADGVTEVRQGPPLATHT